MLLDEPFAALDEITRMALNDDLLRLWEDRRPTVVFVTHSVFESVYLSTRIAVMTARPGRIAAELAVDLPQPRERALRTAPAYAAICAAVSGHLGRAMAARERGDRAARPERWWRIAAPLAVGVAASRAVGGGGPDRGHPGLHPAWPARDRAERCGPTAPACWARCWLPCAITLAALAAAAILGGAIALLFSLSRLLEISLFPYAVILQVTPIVAIAPLIIIWVQQPFLALLVCAWIVAFFPIVSNTTVGLNSADRNLVALFRLYGASPAQTLRYLRLPTALPYFLAGLRISGGLALIGAVVAEFVAGTGGAETGLAFRILEAGYRLADPAPVRGAVSAVGDRHRDLSRHRLPVAPAAAALARKRHRGRGGVSEQGDGRRLQPVEFSRGRRTASWSPSRSGTGRWPPGSRST